MLSETITETSEKFAENTPLASESDQPNMSEKTDPLRKSKIAKRNIRRSNCEPNLVANKPSRILSSENKRKSLLPTSKKSNFALDAEAEIPMLMSKMLKISNATTVDKVLNEPTMNNQKIPINNDKRRSVLGPTKTRTSLIPSIAGDKRPFSFTHRMSVVVKTTLNSPARKIARKSSMGGVTTYIPRKSLLVPKSTAESSKIKTPEAVLHKNALIKTTKFSSSTKTMDPKEESKIKPMTTQRCCLLPSVTKISEKTKVDESLNQKQDTVYTCSFCKEKFRIKSLLDAHKRSHESDNTTPSFVRKPPAVQPSTSASLLGNINQCRYCDKKFALIKALHIHLLQNCSKIPPSEKKKLHYTDLNHVEKAQLPNFFNSYQSNGQNSTTSSVNATPRNTFKYSSNSMNAPKIATETVAELKGKFLKS